MIKIERERERERGGECIFKRVAMIVLRVYLLYVLIRIVLLRLRSVYARVVFSCIINFM